MLRSEEGVTESNALRVAAVYACISLLSRSQAMLPLNLYKRKGDIETLENDHAVSNILTSAPNRWQTPFEFEAMMVAHKLIRGNAYAYISRLAGDVKELVPFNPARMRVEQRNDLELEYVYKYANGRERTFKAADIHHRRAMSTDGVLGLSPIGVARHAIGLAMKMEAHGSKTFDNAAKPSGALKSPKPLSPEAAARLKESFEHMHSGVENAGRTMVLEDGLEWVQIGMSAEDLQFIEGRKLQRNEIAMFFGVPPHMIGDIERGTSWGSGIEQQSLGFLVHTLNPHLVADRQALARDLLAPAERRKYTIKHDTAILTRAEFLTRQNGLQIQYQNGVINADEWRKIEGLNPRADGRGTEYRQVGVSPAPAQGVQPQEPRAVA
jgi:HK97 family phage portal protein